MILRSNYFRSQVPVSHQEGVLVYQEGVIACQRVLVLYIIGYVSTGVEQGCVLPDGHMLALE